MCGLGVIETVTPKPNSKANLQCLRPKDYKPLRLAIIFGVSNHWKMWLNETPFLLESQIQERGVPLRETFWAQNQKNFSNRAREIWRPSKSEIWLSSFETPNPIFIGVSENIWKENTKTPFLLDLRATQQRNSKTYTKNGLGVIESNDTHAKEQTKLRGLRHAPSKPHGVHHEWFGCHRKWWHPCQIIDKTPMPTPQRLKAM